MQSTAHEIVLHLEKADDILYKSIIPLSYKKLLHPEVEQFLVEEAKEIDPKTDLSLVVLIKEPAHDSAKLIPLIHQHFKKQEWAAGKEIRAILRLGWKGLLVAFVFLLTIYLLSRWLGTIVEMGTLVLSLRELFIILSWVALWRPAELLLYEWRPIREKAVTAARLAKAQIRIIHP